ncbi:MAG: HAD family hydrolase [Ruminococcaceae bacterium]|nr:HAD family hydrolase [Oscillospiraceae bacterium]
MKYDLVIFDADGTVLDTIDDIYSTMGHILSKNGYPVATMSDIRQHSGKGVSYLISNCVAGVTSFDKQSMLNEYMDYYRKHCADKTSPFPGMKDVLQFLKKSGCKAAMVSDKEEYTTRSLCRRFLGGLIKYVASEQLNEDGLAENDVITQVTTGVAVSKDRVLYVGDTENDAEKAKKASVDFVCVSWGMRTAEQLKESGVENIVTTPEELLDYIKAE